MDRYPIACWTSGCQNRNVWHDIVESGVEHSGQADPGSFAVANLVSINSEMLCNLLRSVDELI
jgi:hypothetical protein